MSDEKKPKRAPSVMGDDDRANQPRPQHPYPPSQSSVSGELEVPTVVPHAIEFEATPPPIVVDDIGRPITRSRSDSPDVVYRGRRERKTIQEIAEELWPARKALQMVVDQLQRIVALETKVEDMEANGPQAVAAAGVAGLRAELVGHDGKGGIVGHLAETVSRDLEDHKEIVAEVEARATKADRFVRRVLIGAGGAIGGSIIAAVALIYTAGEHAATSKAEAESARSELVHKIDSLEQSLTELRIQTRLLLEARLGTRSTTP